MMEDLNMVKVIEESESKVFPKDPLDKRLLLSSMRDFAPEGLGLGVEKVSRLFITSFGKSQLTVQLRILDEFPKCRMYELDDEGQYIMVKDDLTGEENPKIKIDDGHLAMCTLFLGVTCDAKEVDDDTEFTVYPTSGAYPLFAAGLIENGDLPAEAKGKAFSTTANELREALEGFEFTGKSAKSKGKFKFEYLDVV